ncbi:MAG: GntR family transcriptional regulator [Deltaproteobacteria bacterium]|nr:GntR family transcriptional regulator [Deltaproteobacteria bacterium]MBW2138290.1 GntR family transcriptional regulator [Deltaproteobacteria bacterium]
MSLAIEQLEKDKNLIAYKQFWKFIAEDIKENIISGRYKPGKRLKEAQLAEKYSVSKTPVREAIRYLEGIGFVEMIPHTMIRVSEINKKEVQDLYSIQNALERLAALEALPNLSAKEYGEMEECAVLMEQYAEKKDYALYSKANNNFHSIIWRASGNERLVEMLQNTHERIQRFYSVPRRFPDKFKELAADHRKILEAIAQKDADKLETLLRTHLQKQMKYILDVLQKEKDL